jgi:hypothetical protein
MKTWVLLKHAGGMEEWLEQYVVDYEWQTGQIPGAKVLKIVRSDTKPEIPIKPKVPVRHLCCVCDRANPEQVFAWREVVDTNWCNARHTVVEWFRNNGASALPSGTDWYVESVELD